MKFSEREGITQIRDSIQIEGMDSFLRNKIWNAYYNVIILEFRNFNQLYDKIWEDFFNFRIDERPDNSTLTAEIKHHFLNKKWYEVYNLVEFIASYEVDYNQVRNSVHHIRFTERCNKALTEGGSAYRIISREVTLISDQVEINSIQEALKSKFSGVTEHLENALRLLSERENPDYRNSIKESISAVESICRIITNESTLGKALKSLEDSGVQIHRQLKNTFDKLYLYTNDKTTGIRHALMEEGYSPDFDEAKFMLVSCSAFINYLKSKSVSINE